MVEQLKTDFHNKCYLCEMKDLQDPQIEHLLPHKNGRYPERKYDWNNLFWSCAHCNSMKNQDKYDAGIVDCCRQDPEELISFRLRDKQVEITTTISGNDKTSALTAELIYEIFNKTNTGMRVYKSAVRLKLLTKEMNILYDNLEALKKNPDSKIVLRKLKALLRRESSFAAFKRCYVRENLKEYPQLAEYVAL